MSLSMVDFKKSFVEEDIFMRFFFGRSSVDFRHFEGHSCIEDNAKLSHRRKTH